MKLFASGDSLWRRFLAPGVSMLAVLLVLGMVLVRHGRAQQTSSQDHTNEDGLTAKVLSLEQLWNQAELAKDTQSLDHLLADTFLYVDIDGSLLRNKAEFVSSVNNRSERIESIRSGSMLSHVYGNTVIVTGVYHEKGTLNGKPYYHHGRFTDTWVKEGSAWMCAASQSTLIQK
jgi:ketosteroid isomerase-like protein